MNVVRDLSALLGRLARWWSEDIWHAGTTLPETPPLERLGVSLARTLYIVATGFRTERIKLRAALLTYVTLLSIVPALVVMFSVFAAFRGLADVQNALKKFIASAIALNQQDTLIEYLDTFLAQAGTIGIVGVGIMLITVIMLLGNIEKALNDIWGLRRGRSLLHRFQVYWPLVTLGPILVGLSLFLTAAVGASEGVTRAIEQTPAFGLVFNVLPVLLTWTFLTLLYMLLPNTHVPFRAAVIGGVVAGSLWEGAKQLYALYAEFALSVPSVYGSLAAVPLFVLWIYVTWVVALLGATLTFAIQNARTYEPDAQAEKRKSQRDREFLAARLLVAVSDSFDKGAGAVPAQDLLDTVIVAPRFARKVLAELVEGGLLVETVMRESEDAAYVPGRPLHTISVADIVRAMRGVNGRRSEVIIPESDALGQRVCRALMHAEKAVDDALSTTTLAQLLAEARIDQAEQAVTGKQPAATEPTLTRIVTTRS